MGQNELSLRRPPPREVPRTVSPVELVDFRRGERLQVPEEHVGIRRPAARRRDGAAVGTPRSARHHARVALRDLHDTLLSAEGEGGGASTSSALFR